MSQIHRYSLSVAGVSLELETDRELVVGREFLPFLTGGDCPDYRAHFRKVDVLPPVPDKILYEDSSYRVHLDGRGGYLRSFFDEPRDLSPYAVAACDYALGLIQVDYLEKGTACVSELGNSFFHLGLESLLIQKNRLCIHAACVRTSLGGILFSGPSGIGKSTQALLWCTHRRACLINGDRPILSHEPSGWMAWGSPYAGSSRCYVNESCPVSAVIMLRKADACSLRRLSRGEAFRSVWSGLTVQTWDEGFVEAATDLALALIGEIPVLEFCCTPDEQAVDYLEQGLRKECGL